MIKNNILKKLYNLKQNRYIIEKTCRYVEIQKCEICNEYTNSIMEKIFNSFPICVDCIKKFENINSLMREYKLKKILNEDNIKQQT